MLVKGPLPRSGRPARTRTRAREKFFEASEPPILILTFCAFNNAGGGQRTAQLASALASLGRHVIFAGLAQPTQELSDNLYCLSVHDADALVPAMAERRCPVFCSAPTPGCTDLAMHLKDAGSWICYDVCDDWEGFAAEGMVDPVNVSGEAELLQEADLVTVSAEKLRRLVATRGRSDAKLLRNGGPTAPVRRPERAPSLVANEYRWVFVGSLWGTWFTWRAIEALAADPNGHGLIIGALGPKVFQQAGVADAEALRAKFPNVMFLGEIEHRNMLRYLALCDVGIIPFAGGAVTEAVDPVKLYDYWAAGLPVIVTSHLRECIGRPHVYVADGPDNWGIVPGMIARRYREPEHARPDERIVASESWLHRASTLLSWIPEVPHVAEDQ